jgi:hypothetical protein
MWRIFVAIVVGLVSFAGLRYFHVAAPGDVRRTIEEMSEFGSYRERDILYRAVSERDRLNAKPRVSKDVTERRATE